MSQTDFVFDVDDHAFIYQSAVDKPNCGNDSDVEPCDSASQVTSRYSSTSSKSSVVRRRVEVERRRAELVTCWNWLKLGLVKEGSWPK